MMRWLTFTLFWLILKHEKTIRLAFWSLFLFERGLRQAERP